MFQYLFYNMKMITQEDINEKLRFSNIFDMIQSGKLDINVATPTSYPLTLFV